MGLNQCTAKQLTAKKRVGGQVMTGFTFMSLFIVPSADFWLVVIQVAIPALCPTKY